MHIKGVYMTEPKPPNYRQTIEHHLAPGETAASTWERFDQLCQRTGVKRAESIFELELILEQARPGTIINYTEINPEDDRETPKIMHHLRNHPIDIGIDPQPDVSGIQVIDNEMQIPYLLHDIAANKHIDHNLLIVIWQQRLQATASRK
jgi:hypothetical protein